MKNIYIGISALMFVFLTATTTHAVDGFDALINRGKQHLHAAEYRAAHAAFKQGYLAAKSIDDQRAMTKFQFLTGNTYLVEAEKSPAINQQSLAKKAVRPYAAVINKRPDSGSAKVNLARAYAILGQNREAEKLYRQAIALDDKKQPQYRLQYARFLERLDPKKAARELQAVLDSQPNSSEAQRRLMQLYRTPELAEKLPGYLAGQIQTGNVLQAQSSALEVLEDPRWPVDNKAELMTVVALGLTSQHMSPSEFDASDTANKLQRIAETNPSLVLCVEELMHTMTSGKVSGYRWWVANKERASAISNLMRSRARFHDQEGQPGIAEELYAGAARIVGAKDPTAVQDLVNFYSRRGDLAAINKVSSTYEYELFQGKGDAYRKGDEEAIYDYHRTLASIYSFQASKTGDWGSPSNINSAAFQLKRAYETAAKSTTITPDTKLVTSLATSYEARGLNKQADNLIVDAARNYTAQGDVKAASTVLKDLDITRLSNDEKNRYESLINAVPAVVPTRPVNQKPVLPLEKPLINREAAIRDVQSESVSTVINNARDTIFSNQVTGKRASDLEAKEKAELLRKMQQKQQQELQQRQLQQQKLQQQKIQQANQFIQQAGKTQNLDKSKLNNVTQQNQRPATTVTNKFKLIPKVELNQAKDID